MDNQSYTWTDNPTVSGVSPCNTDVLNECLMHLKYNQEKGDGFKLFDIKITDRKLVGGESVGWMLQGELVTMAYPDAVNQIIQEFDEGATVTYRDISCVQALNGHYVADISQKESIDQLFAETGVADFYILDKANQQFYLPRNNWFMQFSTDDSVINQFVEAGLPNINGSIWPRFNAGTTLWNDSASGAFYTTGTGSAEQRGDGGAVSQPAGLGFDAKRSSDVYGKSSTVQPQSSTKLLYYKVGDTTTDVNQILIDAQKFLEDSSNQLKDSAQEGLDTLIKAKDDGVNAINNASNALNQTQITNCILQTPDLIKYSLENNFFVLKSGSIVPFPYGTSEPEYEIGNLLNGGEIVDISWDGSRLFYYVLYNSDITIKSTASSETQLIYFDENGSINSINELSSYSGDSTPASFNDGNCIYYDTVNNIVKVTKNSGTDWSQNNSLPICLLNAVKDVGYSSVVNIFNLGGYVYNTVWVNKNIKALIPNGLNADGSLLNIEHKTEYLAVSEINVAYQDDFHVYVLNSENTNVSQFSDKDTFFVSDLKDMPEVTAGKNYRIYVANDNRWYESYNGSPFMQVLGVNVIKCQTNAFGKITSFSTLTPYRSLNYSDTAFLASQPMPSLKYIDLTLPASDKKGLIAPADGWVCINKLTNGVNQYISLYSGYIQYMVVDPLANDGIALAVPVAKGASIGVGYSAGGTLRSFKFIYAQGAK